jgi:hypothetical protein
MTKKDTASDLRREYRYASHHHLIPLYVLTGISIVTLMVLGCFLATLWQNGVRESHRTNANFVIANVENSFLPGIVNPIEKKQYIYSANVRFPVTDPYQNLLYAYDPGSELVKTAPAITLTTSTTLHEYAAPLLNNPSLVDRYAATLHKCTQLYIIRFVPGLIPSGGFTSLKDVRLKDGRTAYIHKNATCVPGSTKAMTALDELEKVVTSIESY